MNNQSDDFIISLLQKKLRTRMDGIIASSMREKQLNYKYNFGLSLPFIKELASLLPKRKSLAEKLLKYQTRELKIIGLILYPENELDIKRAKELFEELHTKELKDLYVFFLLSNLDIKNPIYSMLLNEKEYINYIIAIFNRRLLLKQAIEEKQILLILDQIENLKQKKEKYHPQEITFFERSYNFSKKVNIRLLEIFQKNKKELNYIIDNLF